MKIEYLFFLFFFTLTNNLYSQQQKVSLLFAGDAMQHKSQLDAAKTDKGYDYSHYLNI